MSKCASSATPTFSAHPLSRIVPPATLTRGRTPNGCLGSQAGLPAPPSPQRHLSISKTRNPRPPYSRVGAFPSGRAALGLTPEPPARSTRPSASVHSPPLCWGPVQAHREGIRRRELRTLACPSAHVLVPSTRNTFPSSSFRIQKLPHTSMGFGNRVGLQGRCFRFGVPGGFPCSQV